MDPGSTAPGETLDDHPPVALVVDDSETMARLTGRMLERLGWRVEVAHDGISGLEIGTRIPTLRLVVTDQEMPGLRGEAMARSLLAARADLRIVIASGAIETVEAWDPRVALLAKPFTPEGLEAAIVALGLGRQVGLATPAASGARPGT